MSDEASGLVAQIILIGVVLSLWAAVIYGVVAILHGWRP